jgi:acetylornithine deacetylase/succinyl-diaminopimelate desuccinylase-like protein
MENVLNWLAENRTRLVGDLRELVAIRSVSVDGEHQKELEQSAALTCEQMRAAGLERVEVLRSDSSNPYAYGEWLGAPGKPTVFLYAHHDVQPVHEQHWSSDPWRLTERRGRLYGRGAADDKGAITAQLAAVGAFLKTRGSLPLNVKMLVEGEDEIGSPNMIPFLRARRQIFRCDVVVVCDTENVEVGTPSITYSLRGLVNVLVEVQGAKLPVHSGWGGGILPDPAMALNVLLARLFSEDGRVPIPHFEDAVRPMTARERRWLEALPADETHWRRDYGVPPGVRLVREPGHHPYEQVWRKPAITVIAQEVVPIRSATNQISPHASALVSARIVPDQDPDTVYEQLRAFLTAAPPWGVRVTVRPYGAVKPWITEPESLAITAALDALRMGFQKEPVAIGCGGTLGAVGALTEVLGGVPALLLGMQDSTSNTHAPSESLHEGDWRNLMRSLAHLFEKLSSTDPGLLRKNLPGG